MRHLILSIVLFNLLALSTSHAGQWQLGIGAGYTSATPSPDSDPSFGVLPLINYSAERWSFNGGSVDYQLVDSRFGNTPFRYQLSASLSYLGDAVDPGLTSLDQRQRHNGNFGINCQAITPLGMLTANVSADILGADLAQHASLGWGMPLLRRGNYSVMTQATTNWHSRRWGQELYGISLQESKDSGLAAFQPSTSLVHSLGLMFRAQLSRSWGGMLAYKRSWYGDDLLDSPIVSKVNFDSVMAGIMYSF